MYSCNDINDLFHRFTFAIVGEFHNCSVDACFALALPLHHTDLKLDSVGVSTKDQVAILLAWL